MVIKMMEFLSSEFCRGGWLSFKVCVQQCRHDDNNNNHFIVVAVVLITCMLGMCP